MISWRLLTSQASFSMRAWHGIAVLSSYYNIKLDESSQEAALSPRIFLFGGGNIGFTTSSSQRIREMVGRLDAYYSRDGITWMKVSYDEGGGSTTVTQYSSQVSGHFIQLF